MNTSNIKLLFIPLFFSSLFAKETPKFVLMANSEVHYNNPIKEVNSFQDIFKQGTFYGRLRNNNFYYFANHQSEKNQNYFLSGIGGNFVFRSASLNGVSFNTGLYATHAFFNESTLNSVGNLKSAKMLLIE